MNVVVEQFRGGTEAGVIELDVAFDAGTFLLGRSRGDKDEKDQ